MPPSTEYKDWLDQLLQKHKGSPKMTLQAKEVSGKWRIVLSSGDIAITNQGRERDGGGHKSKEDCEKQIVAIQTSMSDILDIRGPIGFGLFEDFFTEELERRTGDLEIKMNSRGGDFFEALGIFNAISLYDKGTITISIEGSALSAASFIAMAADKVKMTDSSLFMIHDPHISIFGSLSELQSRIEMLIKGKDVVVEAYSKSSGQEKAEIQSMMTAETWMNAEEAKEKGFIDEIIELQSESKAVMQVSMDISDSLISKIPEQYRTLLRHTKERANMSELLGLAGDLQVTLQDGAKDEEIRAAIKQKFEEKSAETSAPVSKSKTSLPKSVLTMMADARETQLHALVTEGRITAAARDEFKKQYCDTVKMAASVQEDGEITDGFTGVLAALKKQEAVQTGEVTSMQRPHSLDPNDNPMMRAAQRRLEQYS